MGGIVVIERRPDATTTNINRDPEGPRRTERAWLCICVAMTLTLGAARVSAAEYLGRPWAELQFEYNDNIRLVSDPVESTFGAIARVGGELSARTESSGLRLSPMLRIQRYDSSEDLDSNDFFMDMLVDHSTPKWEFSVFGAIAYDTTLTSELATTGRVPDRRRRFRYDVMPVAVYSISERTKVGFNYTYTNVSYDKGVSAGVFDYTNNVGEFTASYQRSPTDIIFGTFFGGRFDVPQTGVTTDSIGFTVGYSKAFSETLSTSFSLGPVSSTSKGSPFGITLSGDSIGLIYDLNITKLWTQTTLTFGAGQTRTPTAESRLVNRSQVNLGVSHNFDPFWTANAGVLAYSNESLLGLSSGLDSDVVGAVLGVRRQLSRQWAIIANYRFLYKSADATTASAQSNAVFVALRWQGDPHTASR